MLKYFLEIKNRLILLLITWISTILISYFYKETLLFIIIQPNLFININEHLDFFYFIFTDVTEVLSVYLKLVMFLSFQTLYIYITYHLFVFLSSAFFYLEYLYFKFSIKVLFFFLFAFAVLATYFLIPFIWNFFFSFQNLIVDHSFNLHFEAKLKEYFYFYTSFYYVCEFYCQFFAVFLLVLNYTKIDIEAIKNFRKFYYYCFIIFSTLVSPPDILSQIFLSLVFIFIYEFLLLFFLLKTYLKLLIN